MVREHVDREAADRRGERGERRRVRVAQPMRRDDPLVVLVRLDQVHARTGFVDRGQSERGAQMALAILTYAVAERIGRERPSVVFDVALATPLEDLHAL